MRFVNSFLFRFRNVVFFYLPFYSLFYVLLTLPLFFRLGEESLRIILIACGRPFTRQLTSLTDFFLLFDSFLLCDFFFCFFFLLARFGSLCTACKCYFFLHFTNFLSVSAGIRYGIGHNSTTIPTHIIRMRNGNFHVFAFVLIFRSSSTNGTIHSIWFRGCCCCCFFFFNFCVCFFLFAKAFLIECG